jgi:polyhydroxyalkanoate synthase
MRRTWRSIRSVYLRFALNVLAWPHLVDVALGTKRAAVGVTPSEIVWTSAFGATLRRYGGSRRRKTPILVVGSVIAEPWILDLTDGHSLIGHLVDAGHDVYLLDWGTPSASHTFGLAESVDVLVAAERVVLQDAGARKLDLLGYCLGATICLIRAAVEPAGHVRSIAAIAPPVDLEEGGKLAGFMRHKLLRPAYVLDGDSRVPAAVIREAFHALRPQALRSVRLGWTIRGDPKAMAYYGAMARWTWEQRPLAGAMFLDLVSLYRSNAMHTGTLRIGGRTVDLAGVTCPVLVCVAERDHIVPPDSSTALRTGGRVDIVNIPSGHVSMVVGTGARDGAWPALARWFARPPARGRPTPTRGRSRPAAASRTTLRTTRTRSTS